jgi:hypothetical protein
MLLIPLFATRVVDTSGKFTAGVIDTGGNLPPVSLTPAANLPPVLLTPVSTTLVKLVAKLAAGVIDTCSTRDWERSGLLGGIPRAVVQISALL